MRSRMDRYKNENFLKDYSRSDKNKELYNNLGNNKRYTNFTDVTNSNVFDIDEARKNNRTREGYHKMKEYGEVIETPKVKRELDEFNYLYQDHENRVYDINSVLKEAKKNRIEKDELEAKRKLKNTNYNILASLNPEELEKYRKEKQERTKPDEEELRELIDTITSKTLAGEIDQKTSVDLLSDLMATSVMDKVNFPKDELKDDEKQEVEEDDELNLSKEILDKDQIENIKKVKDKEESIMEGADSDFYTRSMDLSDKDFDFDDEFGEKKVPIVVKIILVLILLAIIGVTVYFIMTKL